ncbi:CJH_07325 family protein [Campylobacter lari]|nr:CJH_07325 family protein [Campylobacter lari]MCV3422411.1 CJH_07325 family protein [Campylobacter lari]
MKKGTTRNNYKGVSFINLSYLNTGNVCDVSQTTGDPKLDKAFKKIEKDLFRDREKFKMDDFFANAKF